VSYMGEKPRDLYLHRMRNCRSFQHLGITPEWFPGTGDIEGFIHDEVVRQGHDTRVRADGGVRIEWMQAAWEYAQRSSEVFPDVQDILALGVFIEPSQNSTYGFRTMNVYIGGEQGAPPKTLSRLVPLLTVQAPDVERIQGLSGRFEWRSLWRHELSDDAIVREFGAEVKELETVDDWYLAFESVHPFSDGNGRTGKIFHNWLLGTLDEPVLVEDYFGGGNP
jgi:hypothetical protein